MAIFPHFNLNEFKFELNGEVRLRAEVVERPGSWELPLEIFK